MLARINRPVPVETLYWTLDSYDFRHFGVVNLRHSVDEYLVERGWALPPIPNAGLDLVHHRLLEEDTKRLILVSATIHFIFPPVPPRQLTFAQYRAHLRAHRR